jgi:cardiolipin synthase
LFVPEIGFWGLWAAAILTIVTGWDYLQKSVGHMRAERAAGSFRPARGVSSTS